MPTDPERHVWEGITLRRAEVLRELAANRTEREAAEHLGIAMSGVRSHVERLKALTGCTSVRELGRWWQANRDKWLDYCRRAAGV